MNYNKLIALYCYIYDVYDTELKWHCQRFSNNSESASFTDVELLTTYLFCVAEEEKYKIKSIHGFVEKHLSSWFPDLPSYQAFNSRLNRISGVFSYLILKLIAKMDTKGVRFDISLVDSMPIITCSAKRAGKVAKELTDKGYNSTKKFHFYGIKLHAMGFFKVKGLPLPEFLKVTKASEHDLNAIREIFLSTHNRTIYADKAYSKKELQERLEKENGTNVFTPIKKVKGVCNQIRQMDYAYNKLLSRAISKVRQPIESFFNWLIEKTNIQAASKVRSTKGLLVHTFGKIAAALVSELNFNP